MCIRDRYIPLNTLSSIIHNLSSYSPLHVRHIISTTYAPLVTVLYIHSHKLCFILVYLQMSCACFHVSNIASSRLLLSRAVYCNCVHMCHNVEHPLSYSMVSDYILQNGINTFNTMTVHKTGSAKCSP